LAPPQSPLELGLIGFDPWRLERASSNTIGVMVVLVEVFQQWGRQLVATICDQSRPRVVPRVSFVLIELHLEDALALTSDEIELPLI